MLNNNKMKKIEMIGKKFGKLTVTHKVESLKEARWVCSCDCGRIHEASGSHLRAGNITHCGCKKPSGPNHAQWKGVGDISGDFWYNHIIRSANGSKANNRVRKPKELNIDIEYGWNLFIQQNKKCALSGLELSFNKKEYTASLDRIDSSKGYIKGNVQWVHKHINIMKNKFDNKYFINICKLIAGGACELPQIIK